MGEACKRKLKLVPAPWSAITLGSSHSSFSSKETVTGEVDPRFIHVVVSKKPPYLVNAVEMDFEYELIGQAKVRRALDTYKQCLETGEWPGYEPTIKTIGPPAYYAAQEEDLDEMEVA